MRDSVFLSICRQRSRTSPTAMTRNAGRMLLLRMLKDRGKGPTSKLRPDALADENAHRQTHQQSQRSEAKDPVAHPLEKSGTEVRGRQRKGQHDQAAT